MDLIFSREFLSFLAGSVAGAAMLGGMFYTAYSLANRWFNQAGLGVRVCATLVLGIWFPSVLFYALLYPGVFQIGAALPAVGALTAAVWWLNPDPMGSTWEHIKSDAHHARRWFARLERPTQLGLGATGGFMLIHAARMLASPPLHQDGVTYHLVKTANWVQSAGPVLRTQPGSWQFYQYFRELGDALWAWPMVATHSDVWTALPSLLYWAAILPATYVVARYLKMSADKSVVAAIAMVLLQSSWDLAGSAYVDILLLAVFLLTLALITHLERDARTPVIFGVSAGLALLCGIKFSGFLLAGSCGLAGLWMLYNRRLKLRAWGGAALVATIALLPAIPGYLNAWLASGNIFYPYRLSFGPLTLSEGNPTLRALFEGQTPDGLLTENLPKFLSGLFLSQRNLGLALPLWLILGVAALAFCLKRPRFRVLMLPLYLQATVAVVMLMGDGMLGQRTSWAISVGRFLLPVVATLILGAGCVTRGRAKRLWDLAILTHVASWATFYVVNSNNNFAGVEAKATAAMLLVAVLSALLAWFGTRWAARLRWPSLRALAIAMSATLFIAGSWVITTSYRWEILAHTKQLSAYRSSPVPGPTFSEFIRWADGQNAHLLLVGARKATGHATPLYWFFGSQLQNEVNFLPVFAERKLYDITESQQLLEVVDPVIWKNRVLASGADFLLILPPRSIEWSMVDRFPEHFERVTLEHSSDDLGAFRIIRPPGI